MENLTDPKLEAQSASFISTQALLNRVMMEVNRKLTSGTHYKKMLDFIFDSLDLVIPYDRIGIAVVEGTGDEARLSLKWVKSKIPVTHLNLCYSAPIKGSSLQKVLDDNQPRVINDLIRYSAEHPGSASTKLVIQDGIRSSMTCPLRSDDQQVGVVFFSSTKPNTYQIEHEKIFLEIADELSMIVGHGRLKSDFEVCSLQRQNLNMILHDLKSPLSTIQGFAEMSIDEPWFQKIDSEGKEVFQVFLRNSKYMFDLLNALLEIGKLDQNADLISTEDVQLREFAIEMENYGKTLAEPKGIELNAEISPSLPLSARFDRHKVRRVLDNLFSNAVKYSKRGSKVELGLNSTADRLVFTVRDHGLGIPESEIPKLFSDFGKTSVRPTEGETSTGLGLAIAKRIVTQHSGEISVQSEVGKGSTFTFWIPLSQTATFH